METKNILSHIKDILIIISLIGAVYGGYKWVSDQGKEKAEMEMRVHRDPQTVIKAEQHLENVDEDYKMRMEFQIHVDEVFHELTETAKQLKEQRRQDSIIRVRDAITNYQTKQNVDTLLKFWRSYNASVVDEN